MQDQRWFSRSGCPAMLLTGCLLLAGLAAGFAVDGSSSRRIVLRPEAGAMQVRARVPALGNPAFALGLPETIGCREALLVNEPARQALPHVGNDPGSRPHAHRGFL